MKKVLEKAVKKAFRVAGLDLRRYFPPQQPLLRQVLDLYQVDTILDVGANIGQSGQHFRAIGFPHKIVSFEPIKYLFGQLEEKALGDRLWYVENIALGDQAGKVEINVSGDHAGASSILEMTENLIVNAPDQRVFRRETIGIETLDAMMEKHYPQGDRCFLKLDVQGYEKRVLAGGMKAIDRVVGLKVEMSLVKNYEGEALLLEMLPLLYDMGFRLVQFENGWSNNVSREMYQVDGVFFRTNAKSGASN